MFEVGFSELLLVGVIALLVLGPERLPVAARTAGRWMGQAKRAMNGIKAQMEQELDADNLRRELDNAPLLQLEQELRDGIRLDAPASPTSTTTGHSTP